MRKDRTKLQINRQLRRRPLLDQIRPHGLMSTLFLTGYDQTQAISQTSICRFAITSLLADVRWRLTRLRMPSTD
jgi:hypothetical protein